MHHRRLDSNSMAVITADLAGMGRFGWYHSTSLPPHTVATSLVALQFRLLCRNIRGYPPGAVTSSRYPLSWLQFSTFQRRKVSWTHGQRLLSGYDLNFLKYPPRGWYFLLHFLEDIEVLFWSIFVNREALWGTQGNWISWWNLGQCRISDLHTSPIISLAPLKINFREKIWNNVWW